MTKSVDCSWLADRLVASSAQDLLLVDVRPTEKYVEGHVDGAINLTCSNLMLRRLKKGNLALSVLVNGDEAKAKFAARRKSHYVIVYDEHSSSSELLDLIVARLRDDESLIGEIRILEGGFGVLSKSHPDVCKAKCHRSPARPGSLPHLNLSSLSIGSPLPCGAASRRTTASSPAPDVRRHHDSSKPVLIRPHLFLGSEKDATDLRTLQQFRITHILNVTSHVPNKFDYGGDDAPNDAPRFTYKRIPVQDNWTQDLAAHFDEAFHFIDEARKRGGRLLVHCVAGISRSVTVTIAYIMRELDFCLNDAFDFVKQRKSDVSPNFGFMGQLLEFQKKLDKKKRDSVFVDRDEGPAVQCPNYVQLCAR